MDLQTLKADWEDLPEDVGAISVMGQEGDTKHIWNPKKPDEVEAARVLFNTLTAKGYRAFKLTGLSTRGKAVSEFSEAKGRIVYVAPRKQEDGEMISSFDPSAKRVMFIPPFAGG